MLHIVCKHGGIHLFRLPAHAWHMQLFQNNLTPWFKTITSHREHVVADLRIRVIWKELAYLITRCRFFSRKKNKYLCYYLFWYYKVFVYTVWYISSCITNEWIQRWVFHIENVCVTLFQCMALPMENVLSLIKTIVRPKGIDELYFSSNTQWSQLICLCQSLIWADAVKSFQHVIVYPNQLTAQMQKIHSQKYHSIKTLWCLIRTKIEVTPLYIYRWKWYIFHNYTSIALWWLSLIFEQLITECK